MRRIGQNMYAGAGRAARRPMRGSAAVLCLCAAGLMLGARAETPVAVGAEDQLTIHSGESVLGGETVELTEPVLSHDRLEIAPFNDYVPSFRAAGNLTLAPRVRVPYVRVPYLREGRHPAGEADIAFPPLYVDLALSGAATFTDNIHHDSENRKSDLILQSVLTIEAWLQLTDDLYLSAAGNLSAYRALDDAGVSGFGFEESYTFDDTFEVDEGLGLNGEILMRTQIHWHRTLGLWDVQVDDRFHVASRTLEDPFVDGEYERTTEWVNDAGAAVGRLLPVGAKVGASVRHINYWYGSDFNAWERQEDRATLFFDVHRETMRFKPFAEVTLRKVDYRERTERNGWVHEAHAGFQGPVTDLINAEASVGAAGVQNGESEDNVLWRLHADHLMNSRTRHALTFQRRLQPSPDTTTATGTTLGYSLGRTVGKPFTLWLNARKSWYDRPDAEERKTEHWGVGTSMTYDLGSNLSGALQYSYLRWESNDETDGFYENRVTASLQWDI